METKEQKIERLKEKISELKIIKNECKDTYAVGLYIEQIKQLEQQLKELDKRNKGE